METDNRFKMRNEFDEKTKKDAVEIHQVLNQLADLGWDSHQWGGGYSEEESEYFVETFGKEKRGYLRSDKLTVLACVRDIYDQALKIENCKQHEWSYTHANGHKTCKRCNTFADCTVEEALEHYEKGSIKLDDNKSLYFHHKRPLCSCGSKQIWYLSDSMFDDTDYQCVSCKAFLPPRYDNESYDSFSTHLSPTSDKFLNADTKPTKKVHFDRHHLITLGVVSIKNFKFLFRRYIDKLVRHYEHVMQGDLSKQEALSEWITPHLNQCLKNKTIQIKHGEIRINVTGVKNVQFTEFEGRLVTSYELLFEKTDKSLPTPEENLKKMLELLTNNGGGKQ